MFLNYLYSLSLGECQWKVNLQGIFEKFAANEKRNISSDRTDLAESAHNREFPIMTELSMCLHLR